MTKIPLWGKITILPLMDGNDHYTLEIGWLMSVCWYMTVSVYEALHMRIIYDMTFCIGVGILIWRKHCASGFAMFLLFWWLYHVFWY